MKYKKLIIHNIASIQDAEIDFENGLLSQSNLFLIAGKTGVGKSTILDAICLALYNSAPRLKSAPSGNNSIYEDNAVNGGATKLNEPKLLVRRGASQAFSILYFEGNDGKEYAAHWSVKKTKSRKTGLYHLGDETLLLEQLPDKTFVWDKKKEVLSKIESIIGLNFEQFCRTSLLAQGEFTKFLKADDKEKANILEKLTSTEIYAKIGARIAEKNIEAKNEYENLKSQIGNIRIFSEEDKEKHLMEIDTLSKKSQNLICEQKNLQRQKQWLDLLLKLQRERQEIEQNLQNTISELKNDEVKKIQKRISDWEISSNARIAYADRNLLKQTLCNVQEELKNLSLNVSSFISGIRHEQKLVLKKEELLSEKKIFLDNHKCYEGMYEKKFFLVNLLNNFKENQNKIASLTQEINSQNRIIEEQQKKINEKEVALKTAESKIAETDQQIKLTDAQLKVLDGDKLLNRQREIHEQLTILKDSSFLLQNHLKIQRETEIQQQNLLKKRQEEKEELISVQNLSLELNRLEGEMNEKKRLYDTLIDSIGDVAKQLRHKLSQGDKCPVCGQTVQQILSDEEFESILKPLKEEFEQTEHKFKTDQQKLHALNASINEKKKIIGQLEQDLAQFPAQLNEIEIVLREKLSSINLIFDENVAENLQTLHNSLLSSQSENDLKIKEFSGLQKERDDLEMRFKSLLNDFQKEQSSFIKIKEMLAVDERRRTSDLSLLESTQKETSNLKETLTKEILWDDWHIDLYKTEIRLKEETERYQTNQKEVQSLSVDIERRSHFISRMENAISKLVENGKTYNDSPALEVDDLEDRIQKHLETKIKLESQIRTLSENISEKEGQIHDFIQKQTDFTENYLQQLSGYSTDEMGGFKKFLEGLESKKQQLQGQLKGIEKQIEEHLPKRSEEWDEKMNDGQLSETILKLEEEITLLQQQVGSLNKELQDNELRKKEMADLKKKTDIAYQKSSNWSTLNDIFGTKDGGRFKSIAQSYILQELLSRANSYLKILSNRYLLTCQLGSYAILVADKHRGGEKRPAVTLSGGESFMISLSLALGLSSLAGTTLTSDIVFIDEGFGSLSEDALEPVINMLSLLSQLNGKKVGIISHVEQLKQNIDAKIIISSKGAGAPSTISIQS